MRALLLISALFFLNVSNALDTAEFDNEAQSQRYKVLSSELRCLVCQNQTLADSNADLAVDLKKIVQQQIRAGKSDKEILNFMTQRYGDFILYRPPFKFKTILLWLGPLLFLLFGLIFVMRFVKRTRRVEFNASVEQREKVRQWLEK